MINSIYMKIVCYYISRVLKKMRGSAIRNSQIDKTSKVESGSQIINSQIDKYSFCGYDCQIVNCSIGKFCSIADNVKIGGARHPIEWACTSPAFYYGRDSIKKKFSTFKRDIDKTTVIGNDVWIGANVIVIQGVKIGNGAVIGAGAVVTKNVGDYEIVAGNPAKLIKMRFEKEVVSQLLKSNWWECSDDVIERFAPYIKEPELFAEKIIENKLL